MLFVPGLGWSQKGCGIRRLTEPVLRNGGKERTQGRLLYITMKQKPAEWIPKIGTAVFGLLGGDEPGLYAFDVRFVFGKKIPFPLFFQEIDDMPAVRPGEALKQGESGEGVSHASCEGLGSLMVVFASVTNSTSTG